MPSHRDTMTAYLEALVARGDYARRIARLRIYLSIAGLVRQIQAAPAGAGAAG
jgi:hypothetical protein